MKLTKYAHACVTLEKDGIKIVIDPGTFTPNVDEALKGATAILITHAHGDHFHEEAVRAALDADDEMEVYAPQSVADKLSEYSARVVSVKAGDSFAIGNINVAVFGDTHALIHSDIPQVPNVGYLIDGSVYHPGDAYFAPGVAVRTLLLPTSGPWMKLGEAIDYVREVRPEQAIEIHEAVNSEAGKRIVASTVDATGLARTKFLQLEPSESVEV